MAWSLPLLRSQEKAGKQMYRTILAWTAWLIFSGLIAANTSFASDVNSPVGTTTSISPSGESSQERRALQQLAVMLMAEDGTRRSFHDSNSDDDETKHPLEPTIPEMNCNVNDIANYVSCYGSAIGHKERAERRFTGLIDELQAVLPPDRWAGAEIEPRIGSIRSYTWEDQLSDARVDIDIVPQFSSDEKISYVVTIFGWTAIARQL
jgi:hypothetical protein